MLEQSNFNFRYVWLWDSDIPREKNANLFANTVDPDQTPHFAALFADYPFRYPIDKG